MDSLPAELLIMVAVYCGPYDSLHLSRCCRMFYENLIHFCYTRFANEYSLYRSIICRGKRDSQSATIGALKKAQNAGAPKFAGDYYRTSISYFTVSRARRISFTELQLSCTLLGLAAKRGLEDVATFLHESGVPIDLVLRPEDPTPLFLALVNRENETATRLLDLGACPAPNENDVTAFHIAAAVGYPDLHRFVEEFGMDFNRPKSGGYGLLAYVMLSHQATAQTILWLSQLGADLNETFFLSGRRWSLLSRACGYREWDLARQLLDCGANPTRDGIDSQPLDVVCAQSPGGEDIEERCILIAKLLEKGADPNLRKTMCTTGRDSSLFAYLMNDDHQREVECMLRCPQLKIEELDSHEKTAIFYALGTESGCSSLAKLLSLREVYLPEIFIKDIAHLAGRIYKASNGHKKQLLAEHRDFKRACWVICKYPNCSRNQIDKDVVDLLSKFKSTRKIRRKL